MITKKRKYNEEDKIKAKSYYQKHKEKIKDNNRKYRERMKNGERPVEYTSNPNTKKAKMLRIKIDKIDKKLNKLRVELGIKDNSSTKLKNSLKNPDKRVFSSSVDYYLSIIEEREKEVKKLKLEDKKLINLENNYKEDKKSRELSK